MPRRRPNTAPTVQGDKDRSAVQRRIRVTYIRECSKDISTLYVTPTYRKQDTATIAGAAQSNGSSRRTEMGSLLRIFLEKGPLAIRCTHQQAVGEPRQQAFNSPAAPPQVKRSITQTIPMGHKSYIRFDYNCRSFHSVSSHELSDHNQRHIVTVKSLRTVGLLSGQPAPRLILQAY